MEVSVAVVMSLDGKITRHNETNIKVWAAPEEQQRFRSLLQSHDSEVLGSGTYDTIRGAFKLEGNRLRVVLTKRVDNYAKDALAGILEFSSETPNELLIRLESQGHKKLIVVGGPRMIGEFLKLGVVNKFYVTLEPRLFGQGKPLISDVAFDKQLHLTNCEKLNPFGTLLLTYTVINDTA